MHGYIHRHLHNVDAYIHASNPNILGSIPGGAWWEAVCFCPSESALGQPGLGLTPPPPLPHSHTHTPLLFLLVFISRLFVFSFLFVSKAKDEINVPIALSVFRDTFVSKFHEKNQHALC